MKKYLNQREPKRTKYIRQRMPLTKYFSSKQYEVFLSLLNGDAMYNVFNAGRQSGKTYLLSRLATILAVLKGNERTKILVVAPFSTQTDTFFYDVLQIEGVEHLVKSNPISPYKKILFKNGSFMDFRSADNPNSIRSKSYDYIFIDEFAFFKAGAFNLAIGPTLIASGESCRLFFSSTPLGETGEYYDLMEKGKDIELPDYTFNHIDFRNNPKSNMKFIDLEFFRLAEPVFRQEFLGIPMSDGGEVFRNLDVVCNIDKPIRWLPNDRYWAGIDFGRIGDDTVLTILNKAKEVVYMQEFKGDWDKQSKDMAIILNEYKALVYAESNGVGDAAISSLRKYYKKITPIFTYNTNKKEFIENLRADLMLSNISLPTKKYRPKLFQQMSNYTVSQTKTGLYSYHHRPNEHDDYVDSLALANYAYDKTNKQFTNMMYSQPNDFHTY